MNEDNDSQASDQSPEQTGPLLLSEKVVVHTSGGDSTAPVSPSAMTLAGSPVSEQPVEAVESVPGVDVTMVLDGQQGHDETRMDLDGDDSQPSNTTAQLALKEEPSGDQSERSEVESLHTLDDVVGGTDITAFDGVDSIDTQQQSLGEKIRQQLADDNRPKRDPMLGTIIGERFEVVSKIGSGGMGSVYRAMQRGIDRHVAIKVLHQEMAQNETIMRRFTIEALAVSRLSHPNTIQIFDFGKTELGHLFIAMELLEGRTLGALLGQVGALPIKRALRIIAAVAGSLSEAHAKEIIHRDLKPDNIYLTRVGSNEDYVKVLDFGVAKLRDGVGDGKGTLTKAGSIFGTPRYMSPEQASAFPVDARSDLYSLGVILYEMITGQLPFQRDNPLHQLLAHVNDVPAAPSSHCPELAIPARVEELILKLLEKSADLRIDSAEELAKVCQQLVADLPVAFDEHVGVELAAELNVALPTSNTIRLPGVGDGNETLDTTASPTVDHEALSPLADQSSGARWVWLSFSGLAVLSVAAWLLWFSGEHQIAPVSVVEQRAMEPAESAAKPVLRILIVSRPAGALVVHDDGSKIGQLLGSTPLEIKRKAKTRLEVRLEKKGYKALRRQLTFEANETLDLVLEQRAKDVVVPVAQKRPALGDRAKPARKPSRKPRKAANVAVKPSDLDPAAIEKATKSEVVVPKEPEPEKKKPKDKLVDDLM